METKKEGLKERLLYFISSIGLEKSVFERNVGLSNGFVDKTTNNTRSKSLETISNVYPELNIDWLKTGEGEMLQPKGSRNNITGNGNTAIAGVGHNVSVTMSEFIEIHKNYQDIIKVSQDQISESQKQINRLISIIEKIK